MTKKQQLLGAVLFQVVTLLVLAYCLPDSRYPGFVKACMVWCVMHGAWAGRTYLTLRKAAVR